MDTKLQSQSLDFQKRLRQFALELIKLSESMPKSRTGDVIARQLIRCGTSVGANYRAACHARSKSEFVSKLGIVEEEADECIYWLELASDARLIDEVFSQRLANEAQEIVKITISSIKTTRKNQSSHTT